MAISASGVLSFVFKRLGWRLKICMICWSVSILPLLRQLQFRHDICLWTVSPFQHYGDPVSLVYSSVSSQHGPASWYLKCQVDANGTGATRKIWNSHSRLWQNWLKALRRGPTALFFLGQSICHNHMKCRNASSYISSCFFLVGRSCRNFSFSHPISLRVWTSLL